MKSILAAGLTALCGNLCLPSAAMAQEDWIYVACEVDYQFTTRWTDGSPSPAPETYHQRNTYRFNGSAFDMHTSGTLSWTPLCAPDEEVQTASCSINADAIISRGTGNAPGSSLTRNVTLNRVTGRVTTLHLTEIQMGAFRHEGAGNCAPTTDPTAGQRRF